MHTAHLELAAVNARRSQQPKHLIHESRVVARNGHFDVSTVTGTLRRLETTCRAVVVGELTKFRSVETAGHRVEEGIESGCGRDALRRQGANVLGAQEAEGHASDLAAHGL